MENIARSITLNVDETGTLDYGQNDHNNLVYNTLETHLVPTQLLILKDPKESEDIISIDGSQSEMDVVYQKDTTFFDIALPLATTSPQYDDNLTLSNHPSQAFPTTYIQTYTHTSYASLNSVNNNTTLNVTITQTCDHMTSTNANDVIDVAAVIDQVVTSRSASETLNDSLHIPKLQSIVNLPLNDLHHRLNALHHQPTSE